MNILFLAGSNMDARFNPGEPTMSEHLVALFEAEYHEPVNLFAHMTWPNGRLPALIEGWSAEAAPDIVILGLNAFAYAFPSTPHLLRRRFGKPGALAALIGLRLAARPRIGHSKPFRALSHLTRSAIGGESPVLPAEALEVYTRVLRILARNESALVLATAPSPALGWNLTPAQQQRTAAIRAEVEGAVKALCQSLNIAYIEGPPKEAFAARDTLNDGVHYSSSGVRAVATLNFLALKPHVDAHRAAHPGPR